MRAGEHGGAEPFLTQIVRSAEPCHERDPLPDRAGDVRHSYQTGQNPPEGAPCRPTLLWADQVLAGWMQTWPIF